MGRYENSREDTIGRAMVVTEDPTNYEEAVQLPEAAQWRTAMETELCTLEENSTWELVPRPPKPTNIVTSKWVFKTKRHADGTVDRYKARLVARGFSQVEGLDFFETYAPVVRLEALRVLLAIAAYHDYEIQ
jgi:hypothetical protein